MTPKTQSQSLTEMTEYVLPPHANALGNVSPTHLLGRDVLAAWAARPKEVRPAPAEPPARKAAHHRALPVVSGGVSGDGLKAR